ncbi:MAG: hypothetical protein Q8N23_12035 [Archangium sp.]|nr:hypothetical protein [Archangium sp.]MDP3573445.1 hypothetical protein [Archangium sp.]
MRAVLLVVLVFGCQSAPKLPAGMEFVTASANPLQWRSSLSVVSPVRPPTSVDGRVHIAVALNLPEREVLSTSLDARGERTVKLPVGTVASRIEYRGTAGVDALPEASWKVLDVRQFEWTASGLQCVVLRPAGGVLKGLRWSCGAHADARAGEVLSAWVQKGFIDAPEGEAERSAAAKRLGAINACVGCHVPSRLEDRTGRAVVQRATDAQGLFSLRSLWRDDDPVERYRPVDANVNDDFMTPVCPESEIDLRAQRCADGQLARLRIDVARGMRAADPHVERLCFARRALASRLDSEGRAAWAAQLDECELALAPSN